MKKLIVFSTVSLIVFTMGCSAVDELTKFKMNYKSSVTVPAALQVNLPIDLFTPDISTNSQTEFEINDTRKDLVENIRLDGLSLTISSPSGADFSFLNSIVIYISADGLSEIRIAWDEDVSATAGGELNLETSSENLMEYIKQENFQLRVNTVTDEVLTEDHSIEVDCEFFVDAKILGV